MQVAHAFAVMFIQPAEGCIAVPLKPMSITRRQLSLDSDLNSFKSVLSPLFLPPLLLLFFIAVVSTRWHQPTGTVLRAELGWRDEDNPVRGSCP